MSEQPLALQERRDVAVGPEPTDIMGAIIRAASDPSTDVTKVQSLMSMYERLEAKRAEAAFNDAMSAAQTEMRPVVADKDNKQTTSKYASYGALDKSVRPIYTAHGFSLSFDNGDAPGPDFVRVLCYVAHRDGFSRTYKVDMPADGKGAKGGDVMTKTHATGSANTYGQRYLLKMIFNIAVGDPWDDDGNGAGNTDASITADHLATLRGMLEKSGADIEKFCAYLKIEALPDLKDKDFGHAVTAINTRNKKAGVA